MYKIKVFAVRNAKEILRDPLSYIFALGFPVVMLIIMTIVNESIPPEAGMEIFELRNLAPGVVLFGFTFVMLFTAILMAKDRCGSFLGRLYAAPVTAAQFITGYIAPVMVLGVLQCIITYAAVDLARGAVNGNTDGTTGFLFITIIYGLALLLGAVLVFRKNMRKI